MTKPTTYYVQTPQIDQLVNEFGGQLDGLTRAERLDLRMLLATFVCLKEVEDEWTLVDVVTEVPIFEVSENLEEAIAILDGIDQNTADGLIDALTAQLLYGNARRQKP